jgi:hypothetical protein
MLKMWFCETETRWIPHAICICYSILGEQNMKMEHKFQTFEKYNFYVYYVPPFLQKKTVSWMFVMSKKSSIFWGVMPYSAVKVN